MGRYFSHEVTGQRSVNLIAHIDQQLHDRLLLAAGQHGTLAGIVRSAIVDTLELIDGADAAHRSTTSDIIGAIHQFANNPTESSRLDGNGRSYRDRKVTDTLFRKAIGVRLSPDMAERLSSVSERFSIPRSQMIRFCAQRAIN